MKRFVCLDVGGTEIKAALVGEDGALRSGILRFPSRAKEDRETILGHIASVVRSAAGAESADGVRFAFPGPFDYENGVCLVEGLDKFDAIFGVNLRWELAGRLDPDEGGADIRFVNDAAAFGMGEAAFGEVGMTGRALCVPIGTGCGSVFLKNGLPAGEEIPGVPKSGYIYNTPFLDGCIDDFLSKRGLVRLSAEILGIPLEGRELAEAAGNGTPGAREVWQIFGERLRDALSPFLVPDGFAPSVLCLGGQIMKSAALFADPIRECCASLGVRLLIEEDTSRRVLQGLTRI